MSGQSFFLDDSTFAQFRDYIYELTGIYYADNKRYLLDARVRSRAREVGVEDGRGYLEYLRSDARREAEIGLLIDLVSIHETSFFRHANQIEIFGRLAAQILEGRRRGGDRKLSVWSAACSTGEEAYTLAMVLREQLGDEKGWNIAVTGTDISAGSIEQARRARYPRRHLRTLAEPYLRYFDEDADDPQYAVVKPEITSMVHFEVVSLINARQMARFRHYDFVFCRNVLIYFDDAAKRKVVAALYESLAPGGYLVLGPSDSLRGISDAFQRTEYSVNNFYRKAAAVSEAAAETAPAAAPSQSPPAQPAALPANQSLRLKILIQRLDRGLRDLGQDLDSSLGKVLDGVGAAMDALGELDGHADMPPRAAMQVRAASRQLARVLLFLQVGDRVAQKSEALRALLQELSDRLLGEVREAPDLQVDTQAFDENILAETETDDELMSQDDIDALFE